MKSPAFSKLLFSSHFKLWISQSTDWETAGSQFCNYCHSAHRSAESFLEGALLWAGRKMCVLWADGSPRVRKAENQPCVSGSPSQVMVIALHRLPKGEVWKCRDRQVEACGFPSVWKKITFRVPLCPATYEPTESGSCKLFPCQPLPSSFLTVFLPSISDVRMQLFLSAMRTGALPARLWLYSIPSSSPPWDSDHLT